MSKKVLITGITGFLGAHIAEELINNNLCVYGIIRTNSDTWRCSRFYDKITWLNCDESNWKSLAVQHKPQIIIHAAWSGVSSIERNNLSIQTKNLELLADILEIAKESATSTVIGLGSQAEYGKLNSIVSEDDLLQPETAYGIIKAAAATILKNFCEYNHIQWIWLRLFSFFGEKEAKNWLVPTLINALITNQPQIQLSEGSQKYAYMYVKDMARIIRKMALDTRGLSGIFNISAAGASPLKEFVERIKCISGNDTTELQFGALPLRTGQSVLLEGSMEKFKQYFGVPEFTPVHQALMATINYYKETINQSCFESI